MEAGMDREALRDAVEVAARRVLEEAAFIFTETVDEPTGESSWPGSVVQVFLPFSSTVGGHFMLATTSELGCALAADMLGVEPDAPGVKEKAEDALGEFLNMMAGVTLERVLGTDGGWELSVPDARRVSPAEHVAERGRADVWAHLETEEEEPVEVAVFLESESR
jgi:CheY-specific phosphatase CheX